MSNIFPTIVECPYWWKEGVAYLRGDGVLELEEHTRHLQLLNIENYNDFLRVEDQWITPIEEKKIGLWTIHRWKNTIQ